MTEEKIAEYKKRIDSMSQLEMARMWRFAPDGHIYFNSTMPLFDYFNERFQKLGGFTPTISKRIGL